MTSYANRSFWIDQYGGYEANKPLEQDIQVDVAIVGGGLCGLSCAYNLRLGDAATRVAVLESEVIGFGASGRFAGWLMPQMGSDPYMVRSVFGRDKARAALEYGEESLRYAHTLVEEKHIDCDFKMTGLLKIAFGKKFVPDIEKFKKHCDELGVGDDLEWLDRTSLEREFDSPLAEAAVYEPGVATVNPCKLVRGLKVLAEQSGAEIFESSPAVSIDREGQHVVIKTPRGRITADKVVLATNAYSHLLQGNVGATVRRDQKPMFPSMHVTETLQPEHWQRVVSESYACPIESTFNLYHGYTPTADGRLVLFCFQGIKPGATQFMRNHYCDLDNRDLTMRHFEMLFPVLKGVRIQQTWGGPISFTVDMVPHLGYVGDERVLISTGCSGHGAATALQHGRTFADLVFGKDTELTRFWMVKRKPFKWPPTPLGDLALRSVLGLMKIEDRLKMRHLTQDR